MNAATGGEHQILKFLRLIDKHHINAEFFKSKQVVLRHPHKLHELRLHVLLGPLHIANAAGFSFCCLQVINGFLCFGNLLFKKLHFQPWRPRDEPE